MLNYSEQALKAEQTLTRLMRTKRATIALSVAEFVYLRYHATDVATYDFERRKLFLNNGGHMTRTSKLRMNQFCEALDLPCRVVADKGDWHLLIRGERAEYVNGGQYFVPPRGQLARTESEVA